MRFPNNKSNNTSLLERTYRAQKKFIEENKTPQSNWEMPTFTFKSL